MGSVSGPLSFVPKAVPSPQYCITISDIDIIGQGNRKVNTRQGEKAVFRKFFQPKSDRFFPVKHL